MRINKKGESLIKRFEGLSLSAYSDAVGVITIGWGHTKTAKLGQKITLDQAQKLFEEDIKEAEQAVQKYVKENLNSNEYSALVSFVYNVGVGNFKKSTLLKLLNRGDKTGAAEQFQRWHYAGGKSLRGLVRRRKAETDLFNEEIL